MKTFSFETDNQGVCVIRIDTPGERENRVSRSDLQEIERFINGMENEREIIENEKEIKAVVLISGKEDSFIAGAELGELLRIVSVDEGRSLCFKAQDILNRIENSRVPFVAAINGGCLGLGLEIALACKYRITTDDPKTILGLPGIELGLIPFAGGTQRFPRFAGISEGIDMIISGCVIDSKKALGIGLVDESVPKEILLDLAKERALRISMKRLKPKRVWVKGLGELISEKNPIGKKIIFENARRRLGKRDSRNHLAPVMAIEALETGANSGAARGFQVESAYFGELVVSDVSRNLIRVFLSQNALKKDLLIGAEIKPKKVEKIAVLGAGDKGSGIAVTSAGAGIRVRLKDRDEVSLGKGLRACWRYFEERRRHQSITWLEMEKSMNLISGTSDYSGFRTADMVIEAVAEDLESKRTALVEVESVVSEDAVYASDSYSIPISHIARYAKRPHNVLGMQFFSPVHKTPLLEIAVTNNTSEKTMATALELGKRLGKAPIVVKDGFGFYTTRVITPYLNEALNLLGEGTSSIENIDNAMIEFGFPQGPLTVLDEIGIDEWVNITAVMQEGFGERMKPPSYIEKLIQSGRLGTKSGRGFYVYKWAKRADKSIYKTLPAGKPQGEITKEEIQERLSLIMINEALMCLEEGIIKSPRDGDVGAVLGLGFPPFLGGVFRYVDSAGAGIILRKLEYMASKFSPRFVPSTLLRDLAIQGKKFYND